MNKRLLLLSFFILTLLVPTVRAQLVENGSFETWSTQTLPFQVPDVVPPTKGFTTSNYELLNSNTTNMTKVTGNGGGSAMRLETIVWPNSITPQDTTFGYAIWGGNPGDGGGGFAFPGGFPFTDQNVTALQLDMKYNIHTESPGMILVQFKKNGMAVGGNMPGMYAFEIEGSQTTFTTLSFPITPALTVAPDSVVIAFISNNPFDEDAKSYPGDYMEVDNILFVGTTPTVPGGDLESWVTAESNELPAYWNFGFDNESSSFKTNDAHSGNHAIQLQVIDGGGEDNNVQRMQLGYVTYGTPNTYKPGGKVPNTTVRPKSIGFYNKYSSPGLDTAGVMFTLTKWTGTSRIEVGYGWDTITKKSDYMYKHVAINYHAMVADNPDSIYIEFSASRRWPGNIAGSRLLVDDVRINYCDDATAIDGPTELCANATGSEFSITDSPGATYTWTVPSGANIMSGNNTSSITVDFGSTGGNVMVTKTYPDGCADVNLLLAVNVITTATADAGTPQSVCANNTATLDGSLTGAGSGQWSTSGSGTFTPNATTLNAVYTPSAGDVIAGSVTLTLVPTGVTCSVTSDNVVLSFTSAPVVDAGDDQSKCSNNATVSLTGSVSLPASGGTWSTLGNGSFADAASTTTTYIPSASDKFAGSVKLVLTSSNNGNCLAETDTMKVTFTAAPTVTASDDITKCSNNASTSLSASFTVATGVSWSGGAGTYSPSNTNATITYTPTDGEITAGTVTLIATSTDHGSCSAVTDNVVITIAEAPSVNAGSGQSLCSNVMNPNISLGATVENATGGIWTSNGTGSFSDNTDGNAIYDPSEADLDNGGVYLTWTTTGHDAACAAAFDIISITYTAAPTVDAGANQSVCKNNATISLSATTDPSTGIDVTWSGGSGTFTPDANSLNANYTPTQAEIDNGTLTLTVQTSGGIGGCLPESDAIDITFTTAPTVSAGGNQTVCATTNATLNGSKTLATGILWTSNGSGTFSPNNTTANATYIASGLDKASGSVTLTIETTGNGNCNPVEDSKTLTFQLTPTVNAGSDVSVCTGASATLTGTASNYSSVAWSGGTGTFTNASSLSASYAPAVGETSVTLTLTVNGNTPCAAVTDQVTVSVSNTISANAGSDFSVCSGADATLSGSVVGASGGLWTSTGTGTFADATSLNTTYNPSAADESGTVTLTLTTTGTGSCSPASDVVVLSFTSSTTANAGSDHTICSGDNITLNGVVSGATGGQWTGGAGAYTPDANTLNTVYTPTAADITAGEVTLTLTTTGNGACSAATDAVTVTIDICSGLFGKNNSSAHLNVYPSPSNSIVNVEAQQGIMIDEIAVLNALQEEVSVRIVEMNGNTAVLDLTGLTSGMYFVRIVDGESVIVQKVIKE